MLWSCLRRLISSQKNFELVDAYTRYIKMKNWDENLLASQPTFLLLLKTSKNFRDKIAGKNIPKKSVLGVFLFPKIDNVPSESEFTDIISKYAAYLAVNYSKDDVLLSGKYTEFNVDEFLNHFDELAKQALPEEKDLRNLIRDLSKLTLYSMLGTSDSDKDRRSTLAKSIELFFKDRPDWKEKRALYSEIVDTINAGEFIRFKSKYDFERRNLSETIYSTSAIKKGFFGKSEGYLYVPTVKIDNMFLGSTYPIAHPYYIGLSEEDLIKGSEYIKSIKNKKKLKKGLATALAIASALLFKGIVVGVTSAWADFATKVAIGYLFDRLEQIK